MKICPDLRLKQLSIPQLPMLIEEAFALLCWQSGAIQRNIAELSVSELAHEAGLPQEGVIKRLEKMQTLAADVEIDGATLQQLLRHNPDRYFILDVRESWEFNICKLANSQLMAEFDLAQVFEGLKEYEVITVCHHGVRSLSAAMYLKESGLPRVKSLRGGLDMWAQTIDPTMPRY